MRMPSQQDSAEAFVESLFELSHVYDPAKAREYYLRTRELKGRKKGSVEPTAAQRVAAQRAAALKRQKELAAKVFQLEARLTALKKVLSELVKQAKARSGVVTPTKKATPVPSKGNAKPLTSAQKHDAAKRSADYRKKNEPLQNASDKAKELENQIKAVTDKIVKMRKELAAAKKRTNSKTASNGR